MGFNASFDTSEVAQKMKDLTNGLQDLSEPFDSTGEEIIEFLGEENFDKQGAALGEQWRPHSVWTLQARARRYGHYAKNPIVTNKILIWTGDLKAGFTKAVERTTLTIENTVEYFKYNIQSRKMMGINSNVIAIIEKNFTEFIQSILK